MAVRRGIVRLVGGALGVALVVGCAGGERAVVGFSYVVEPERGLPPGMKTIAVVPAKVGPTTDPKWSDMSSAILLNLVNESRTRFGTDIAVTERRDTQATFDEADLAAAGMSTRTGGQGGQLLAADGMILANINVKVEKHAGKQTAISGLDLSGFGGHGWGGGRTAVQTREVETVTRNVTVQTEFKLVDTANGRVWEHYMPATYSGTESTKANFFFGSAQTEAALTPVDRITGALVEQGAREFIARLMKCGIQVTAEVESSANKNCVQGVRLLRAELWDEALASFRLALSENPNDHHAAYGAGLACEASGRFDEAMRYYRQACAGKDDPEYAQARDRVKAFGSRARARG
ncbi:MAG TPA: hypothetical protein PKK06_02215 [Phycisphaerae bacterium]|nr:hypothetical protein [Phycisphaerae bacterium]HNU44061.1 hypothetical protein [Phycisphaerae bacterium]